MDEALRIVIDALTETVAVEEAAADALFKTSIGMSGCGRHEEAEAIRVLSRMHRIKALGLQGQIAVLRDTAVRRFRNSA